MEDGRLPLNPRQAPTLRLGEEGSLWLGLRFSTLTVQQNHMEAVKKPKVHAAFQINLTGEASIRILSSSSRNAPGLSGGGWGRHVLGAPCWREEPRASAQVGFSPGTQGLKVQERLAAPG